MASSIEAIGDPLSFLLRSHYLLCFYICGSLFSVHAQITTQNATPMSGGHDYIQLLDETVNPSNGSVSLRIQLPTAPGRGLTIGQGYNYDSASAYLVTGPSDNLQGIVAQSNLSSAWTTSGPRISWNHSSTTKYDDYGNVTFHGCGVNSSFIFQDINGEQHSLGGMYGNEDTSYSYNSPCGADTGNLLGGDGSVQAIMSTADLVLVADAHGTIYTFGLYVDGDDGQQTKDPIAVEDTNGNIISYGIGGLINGVATSLTMQGDTFGRPLRSFIPAVVTVTSTPRQWSLNTKNLVTDPDSAHGCSPILTGKMDSGIQQFQSIGLPNGTSYKFEYDQTYGLLSKVTYPNGAFVSYEWGVFPLSDAAYFPWRLQGGNSGGPNDAPIIWNGGVCSETYDWPVIQHRYVSYDGVNTVQQQDFTYETFGYQGGMPNARRTTVLTKDLVAGTQSSKVYSSTRQAPNPAVYFSQSPYIDNMIVTNDGTGTALETVTKSWYDNTHLSQLTVQLNDGSTSETDYTYYCPGLQQACPMTGVYGSIGQPILPLETDYYDFGQSSHGGLIKKVITSYASIAPSPYFQIPASATNTNPIQTPSILDRPSQVTTYDDSGPLASTVYCYDQRQVTGLPGIVQHDDSVFTASYNLRGNLTQKLEWHALPGTISSVISPQSCGQGNSGPVLSSTYTYDQTGQLIGQTDPRGTLTTLTYSDAFRGGAAPQQTNGYLTKVSTAGISHQYTWDFPSGLLATTSDQNDINAHRAGATHYYNDPLLRATETDSADGGKSSYQYADIGSNPTITSSQAITSQGMTKSSMVTLDGLGHAIGNQLLSDPNGAVHTDSTYDGNGLIRTISNPYRGSPGTSNSTAGVITTFVYDALSRKITQTNPDGSSRSWRYNGKVTILTDESLNLTTTTVDALGRLIQVQEADGNNTSYTYSALGNLTSVVQSGNTTTETARTRSFSYDSLSRLLWSKNPETGLICYGQGDGTLAGCKTDGYDGNGNNIYRTDARGVVVTNNYDALNRLTSKSYSDGTTAAVSFSYDEIGDWGASGCGGTGFVQCNTVGRLSSMSTTDGLTASVFSYDAMGRMTMKSTCVASLCGSDRIDQIFTYDLSGDLTSYDHGKDVARNVYYGGYSLSYDNAARLAQLSTLQPAGSSVPSVSLFGNTSYGPIGLVSSTVGSVLNESRTYDVRARQVSYRAVPASAANTSSIVGFIETVENSDLARFPNMSLPSSSLPQNGNLTVSGWAGGASSCPVTNVEVDLDQTAIGYAKLGIPRLDVQTAAYSNDGAHQNCGYSFTGSIGHAVPGTHVVSVYGLDSNTNRTGFAISNYSVNTTITVTAQAPPGGFIDVSVAATVPTGGLINLSGWAIDSQMHAPIGAVKILLDGQPLGYATLNQQRPGVASVYNDQRYLNSGWTFTGGIGATPVGAHTISAIAYDSGGQSYVLGVANSSQLTTFNVVEDTSSTEVIGYFDGNIVTGGTSNVTAANGTITVDAWAAEPTNYYGCASQISRIDILIDGQFFGQAQGGVARLDVANGYGNPNCLNTGFGYTGSVANVDPGVHVLTARAYDENGGSVLLTNTATLQVNAQISPLSGGNSLPTTYAWSLGYDPVGNVSFGADTVNGNNAYLYDRLNRLTAATWGTVNAYQWSYDSFGNRLSQTVLAGTGITHSDSFSGGNNRADDLTYDLVGNALNDMTHIGQFTYDGEGRLLTSDSTKYLYDAQGQRVAKYNANTLANVYLYDNAGHVVTELDGSFNPLRREVYADDRHIGTYDASGSLTYPLSDWIGTTRAVSNSSGVICQTIVSQPFGGEEQQTGYCSPTPVFLTGKERDTESGLDYFGKRFYSGNMGRWISPDLVNVTEERMMNPSSTLNKYAYAANNPLKYVDPDGQDITYFYDQSGAAGHAVLFAYNQANGQSAIESFGPASKSALTRFDEVTLDQVPAKSMFDMNVPTADMLRTTYSAITIQTSPELTQQVIDYIRSNPDPETWGVLGPNCSSEVWKILQKFNLMHDRIGGGGITPTNVFYRLLVPYGGPARGGLFNGGHPRPGADYGRNSHDMFELMFRSLHEKVTVTLTYPK